MTGSLDSLTDKEKQALRLLTAGHDAKTMARHLGLSVHTIHERLRGARRKLGTSSSREAARLLREHENAPEKIGHQPIGDAPSLPLAPSPAAQAAGHRPVWHKGAPRGAIAMTFALTLAVAAIAATLAPTAAPAPSPESAAAQAADRPAVTAARAFLALIDADDWDRSWQATGEKFKSMNTPAVWRDVSMQMRAQFGRAAGRDLLTVDRVPAPPYGYTVVRFRARYAQKADAVETVSLAEENGGWRVAGITIE